MIALSLAVGVLIAGACPAIAQTPATTPPLARAHAHNDYEHDRPLLDALEQGFCSVEADIHLVNGGLLVAHDADEVRTDRTLERLYLEPLKERTQGNGGRVYRDGPPFYLLIDIKTEAESTYRVLREVLSQYAEMLVTVDGEKLRPGPVSIVISGNRPIETMTSEQVRNAGIDGRLSDLESTSPAHLMPWISDNWRLHFRWNGEGTMPAGEREKLKGLVESVHEKGRMIRLWATPDRPEAWKELADAGVDLINTDDLPGLAAFLRMR
jgi:hypothetical protein